MSKDSSSIALSTGSPFAVVVMFFGYGFVGASSFSRMLGIRDQLGCTPTQLAFALVCMGVGSILGMPFSGRLVDRCSSAALNLDCWWRGKDSIRLTSKFVSEVLLCSSEIKLVNEEKFPAAAPFKLADQKRV